MKRKSTEWLILLFILGFGSIIFLYADLTSTYDNSMLLIRAIRHGEFFHYYGYTVEHAATVWAANYSLFIYLIFAIWNFPTFLACHVMKKPYINSSIGLFWCKILLIIAVLLIAYYIYKIMILAKKNEDYALLSSFLFLTSMSCILPVFILAQIDSISLLLIIVGFYYYLKMTPKSSCSSLHWQCLARCLLSLYSFRSCF